MSFISKLAFERYYTHIIIPNQHRIKSFYSSNLFVIDLIFTSSSIVSKFHRLETLILKNLESKYLGNILKYLTLLPHLFLLTIAVVDCKSNKTTLYRQTFSLP
ncbi:unnamed protein product, partial [Rotaria sordida]